MTTYNACPMPHDIIAFLKNQAVNNIRLCSIILTAIILATWSGQALATERQQTVILPLKINAPGDQQELTQKIDSALAAAITADQARSNAFTMLSRQEAAKQFNYNATWPPVLSVLKNLAGNATLPQADYIAAGSLTAIGKQVSIDIKVFDLLDPSNPTFYYLDGQNLSGVDQAFDKIITDILAYTGRTYLIANIVPEGNERIDSGAILRNISSRAGDFYDPLRLRDDLKSVFKMGYFDDARISVSDTEKGKTVTFAVIEKPVINQVTISGQDELKEESVLEVVTIASNTILNPKKVREAVDNIQALYKSKGFYNTEVTANLSYPKEDRVDIEFTITEGPKVHIKEIRFVGNNSFKDSQLKSVMGTKEKGIFSWITESGVLKREILDQDAARVTAFYHNNGYIEAKVGDPEINQEEEWLYVTFNISEGERYRVGSLELTGDLIGSSEELNTLLKIREQEYLNRGILREDILRVNDYYAEHGYAFAEAIPKVNTSSTDKKVDIVIDINKGDLVYINRIAIKGNTRTRDKVIRRELLIREKGVFDSKAMRRSHSSLQRLNFFEEVNITPEATADRTQMNIIVEVKEKPTGAFSVGAGYSSVDSVMFMGEVSQNNLFGRGQRLALQANISGTSTRYNISFTEPHLYDTQLLVGFDLYNWERQYDFYDRDSRGFALRFGYPVWELWRSVVTYGYDDTDLTNVQENAATSIKNSVDIHVTSYVALSLNRDTRDQLFGTLEGSHNSVNIKYAGGFLGGDSAFTKVDGFTSWFLPAFFFSDTAFHVRLSAGQIFEDTEGDLPDYEKFYLGGINSIRGFPTRSITAEDEIGEEIGGTRMWFTNIEYLFPLIKDAGLRGVIFFDAGNVYEKDWDFERIKKSVGAGFRWLSPMGPLRLEWGYVIDPQPDEETSNWDFTIGGAF